MEANEAEGYPPPGPGCIAVGSVEQARAQARLFDAVLSIEDPRPAARLGRPLRRHWDSLVLRFEDVDEWNPAVWTADRGDARAILAFGRKHARGSLLVHCHAGIARSTAAAYGILADRLGPGWEQEALAQLLDVRPQACPNLLLVRLLDDEMGRHGALARAVARREAGNPRMHAIRTARQVASTRNRFDYAPRPRGRIADAP